MVSFCQGCSYYNHYQHIVNVHYVLGCLDCDHHHHNILHPLVHLYPYLHNQDCPAPRAEHVEAGQSCAIEAAQSRRIAKVMIIMVITVVIMILMIMMIF